MTNSAQPKVGTYELRAGNGRHIRMATEVKYPGGDIVRFVERLSKREAIRQANVVLLRRWAETPRGDAP